MAALCALQLHPLGKVAICCDSEYVLLGARGAGQSKDGWDHVDRSATFPSGGSEGREILWIKVAFHVTIGGNNKADRLAKIGPHAHPLYPCGSQCVPTSAGYGSCIQDPFLTGNLRMFAGLGENY